MVATLSKYWTHDLVGLACDQFALDYKGYHGVPHWARVAHHAIELSLASNLDPTVPALFALFHDSCREEEHNDPEHGKRAAHWVRRLAKRGKLPQLSTEQVELLSSACSDHSEGYTHAHPIVEVCWDADRLDLGRVGLEPDPKKLCTALAQDPERIRNAYRWSQGYAKSGRIAPSLKKRWAAMR